MTAGYTRLVLLGRPITKKNSQNVCGHIPHPSKRFLKYQKDCLNQIFWPFEPISSEINLACVYYMPTSGTVDLCNLINGTQDILVHAGVLKDDNYRIVAGLDGCRVYYDRRNPRVEIVITGGVAHD